MNIGIALRTTLARRACRARLSSNVPDVVPSRVRIITINVAAITLDHSGHGFSVAGELFQCRCPSPYAPFAGSEKRNQFSSHAFQRKSLLHRFEGRSRPTDKTDGDCPSPLRCKSRTLLHRELLSTHLRQPLSSFRTAGLASFASALMRVGVLRRSAGVIRLPL